MSIGLSTLVVNVTFGLPVAGHSCRSNKRMVTDIQLAVFANFLGIGLFLLVVLYHYLSVNNPKSKSS
ncbi:hypothetical protein EB796_020627 [Bugula neritina]|uniref:Dolichyl-diphosphooligosaccharide--protein glycosyltransferase subunit 4 n=1 Tax=Bugula neritina TaxID=10212 RepID=A0A7J7J462_BUGNE|nr:hypothetical protein EB796_020627 [Bugula neritina]